MYKTETLQKNKRSDFVLCGMRESSESLKKRDQDQCFWCHKVMSLVAPPWTSHMAQEDFHECICVVAMQQASTSADFSLSRNK